MTEPLKFEAYLTGISTKVDGSITVRFNSQEMSGGEIGKVADHRNVFGWLYFYPNPEMPEDAEVPAEPAQKSDCKTPAERLRGVLYALFMKRQQEGSVQGVFQTFYGSVMEKVISHYKGKLE